MEFCRYVLGLGSIVSYRTFGKSLLSPALPCDPSYHHWLLQVLSSFVLLVLIALWVNLKWSSSFTTVAPLSNLTPFTRWRWSGHVQLPTAVLLNPNQSLQIHLLVLSSLVLFHSKTGLQSLLLQSAVESPSLFLIGDFHEPQSSWGKVCRWNYPSLLYWLD